MSKTDYACDTDNLRGSILKKLSELKELVGVNEYDELMTLVNSNESLFIQDSSGTWYKALNKISDLLKNKKLTSSERDQLVEIRRMVLEFCDLITDE